MPLVIFLKGVNVGGHRTFRPSLLAAELRQFDAVNIGAAGTFVIRRGVGQQNLRAEVLRRLPFEAEVMICRGSDIISLVSSDPFAGCPARPNLVRFVSVLRRRPQCSSPIPLNLPASGPWCLKILSCRNRFVMGIYRREMKAIGYLAQLDKLYGVPVATRNWNTILTIARILQPH
jgi:hypothetical protein